MKKIFVIFALISTLLACSDNNSTGNSPSVSPTKNSSAKQPAKQSKLAGFIDKENPCELILPKQKLQILFDVKTEIRVSGSEYKGSAYCDFSWDRADKAEREGKYLFYRTDLKNGKVKETPKRKRAFASSFRVVVSKTNVQQNRFVPPQQSEEAIQQLIDESRKRTTAALTDEQKTLAGDSANDMVENLIRKSNQITEIENLGDAAYWTNLIGGMLYILDGNADVQLSIIEIGDTIEEDIINSQKIAKVILN